MDWGKKIDLEEKATYRSSYNDIELSTLVKKYCAIKSQL